jgi:hypothetical protein
MFAVYKSIKTINSSINQPEIMKAFVFKIVVFLVFNSINIQGQGKTNQEHNILGKWEGKIEVNKENSAAIIWRFEQSNKGKLIGFMGPASQGVATLPMSDLLVKRLVMFETLMQNNSFS